MVVLAFYDSLIREESRLVGVLKNLTLFSSPEMRIGPPANKLFLR